MEKILFFSASALIPVTLLSIVVIVQKNKKKKKDLRIKQELNRRRVAESLRRNTFV